MSAADFEARDYDAVARLLGGFAPVGLGSGFLGLFEEGETIEPPPTPSPDRSQPTFYVRWAIDYTDEPERTFDPDSEPIRQGHVLHAVRIQPGARSGWVKRLFTELRATYQAASSDELAFFPESRSERIGQQDGWVIYLLPIRFLATG